MYMRSKKAAKRMMKVMMFLAETDPNTPEGREFVIKMMELVGHKEAPKGLNAWGELLKNHECAGDWLNQ